MAVSGLGSHNPYINASNSANSSQAIKPRHHHHQDDDSMSTAGAGAANGVQKSGFLEMILQSLAATATGGRTNAIDS